MSDPLPRTHLPPHEAVRITRLARAAIRYDLPRREQLRRWMERSDQRRKHA